MMTLKPLLLFWDYPACPFPGVASTLHPYPLQKYIVFSYNLFEWAYLTKYCTIFYVIYSFSEALFLAITKYRMLIWCLLFQLHSRSALGRDCGPWEIIEWIPRACLFKPIKWGKINSSASSAFLVLFAPSLRQTCCYLRSFRFHGAPWVENAFNVLVTSDLQWKHLCLNPTQKYFTSSSI